MATSIEVLVGQLKYDLSQEEGYKEWAYPDPLSQLAKKYPMGKSYPWGDVPARTILASIPGADEANGVPWTVGFGFTHGVNPESRVPRLQAERKLEGLIQDMDTLLTQTLGWYKDSSFVTKSVLIDMAFNMGISGLLKFKNTLEYMKKKAYLLAAQGMSQSLWYKQTGSRSKKLVQRMALQVIEPQNLQPLTKEFLNGTGK